MATHLVIDDNLIEEACVMKHHITKKSAVIGALQEYIQKRK